MKRIRLFFTLILIGLIFNPLLAQDYQVRMTNFKQVSEIEFQYDIQIRNNLTNPAGADAWAYNSSQFQIDINTAMMNGGQFDDFYFDLDNSNSDLPANQQLDKDANDFFYSEPNTALATNSPSTGNNSPVMLLNNGDWRTISRFIVKLRDATNTGFLNFADVHPSFIFRFSDTKVFSVPYYIDGTGIARRANEVNTVELVKTVGDLVIDVPDRELAGYWYTGKGDWDEQTTKGVYPRWNNETDVNKNTLPGETNNSVVDGRTRVHSSHAVKSVRVNKGGFMLIDETGKFTTNHLENENQEELAKTEEFAKVETVTIAEWNFMDTEQTTLPYFADAGNNNNTGSAFLNTTASFQSFATPPGERFPQANTFYYDDTWGTIEYRWWVVQFSTAGFNEIKYSVNLTKGVNGPEEWNVYWSLDGTSWNVISGSEIQTTTNNVFVTSSGQLPIDVDDNTSVYLRWKITESTVNTDKTGNGAINDIIITGKPLPVGVLVRVGLNSTGSLIHYNTNVQGLVERYIKEESYHLVSIPFTQNSNPVSGWFIWSYLFKFDVANQNWVSMGSPTNTPLDVDQGYMVYKYPGPKNWSADTTYIMEGILNSGDFSCNLSGVAGNYNLVPNPYPSVIDWDAETGWEKTNLNGAYWIWKPTEAQYASYNNGTGTNGATQFIPVGHSFFVQAAQPGPALAMNNEARKHPTAKAAKDTKNEQDILRIKTLANDYSDEIVVRFVDESTNNFDSQYDAGKMYGLDEAPQLYSIAADNSNLSINSLPYSDEVISIPVGFKLEVAGEATFKASSLETFDPDVTIFLWDMLTNVIIDLREEDEYTFMHHPDNDPARFALLFNSTTTVKDELDGYNLQLYAVDNNLYLNIPTELSGVHNIHVYNTNGVRVYSTTAASGSSVIALPRMGSGIYIVRLISDDHVVVRKVYLN